MRIDSATLRAAFPVELTKIAQGNQPPTYTELDLLQCQCNQNAISVPSNGGDGAFGHAALVMAEADYLALTKQTAWTPPVNPPDQPTITSGASAAMIAETTRVHKAEQINFQTAHATSTAIASQIQEAVPDVYLRALKRKGLGYANVAPRAMLAHLWKRYGDITPEELGANLKRMCIPWHPPTPIEALYNQLEDGMIFAEAGKEPIQVSHALRLGLDNIHATGLFEAACRDWRLSADEKTMLSFQTRFRQADADRRLTATTGTAGYHGPGANAALGTPPTNGVPPNATTYCWTHGHSRNLSHTSQTCLARADGHQEGATASNTLGGNTKVWTAPKQNK
jgi:hypothetical protein